MSTPRPLHGQDAPPAVVTHVSSSPVGLPQRFSWCPRRARRPPRDENILYLAGERGRLVNNACFPSTIAPSYAPPGQVWRSSGGSLPCACMRRCTSHCSLAASFWFSVLLDAMLPLQRRPACAR